MTIYSQILFYSLNIEFQNMEPDIHNYFPMTTALFMLRCVELGLNIADLDLLTIGSVNDMFNEKSRDSMEWREEATQADMDRI